MAQKKRAVAVRRGMKKKPGVVLARAKRDAQMGAWVEGRATGPQTKKAKQRRVAAKQKEKVMGRVMRMRREESRVIGRGGKVGGTVMICILRV